MIIFVIPLRSQKSSKSWDKVLKHFERCIKSVCNQTNQDFQAIVVCNEKPVINFDHPNIKYVYVNFLPSEDSLKGKRRDKVSRISTGIIYAAKFSPSHIMVVDADDCISKNIAEYVNSNYRCNGWYINRGYVYQEESKLIYLRRSSFNKWTGTSHIIRFNLLELPESQEKVSMEIGEFYHEHRQIVKRMVEKGTPLEPLPFTGAVYIIGNSENIYQSGFDKLHNENKGLFFRIKDSLNFRLLTPGIRNEFSLYDIRLDTLKQ